MTPFDKKHLPSRFKKELIGAVGRATRHLERLGKTKEFPESEFWAYIQLERNGRQLRTPLIDVSHEDLPPRKEETKVRWEEIRSHLGPREKTSVEPVTSPKPVATRAPGTEATWTPKRIITEKTPVPPPSPTGTSILNAWAEYLIGKADRNGIDTVLDEDPSKEGVCWGWAGYNIPTVGAKGSDANRPFWLDPERAWELAGAACKESPEHWGNTASKKARNGEVPWGFWWEEETLRGEPQKGRAEGYEFLLNSLAFPLIAPRVRDVLCQGLARAHADPTEDMPFFCLLDRKARRGKYRPCPEELTWWVGMAKEGNEALEKANTSPNRRRGELLACFDPVALVELYNLIGPKPKVQNQTIK
jgi:hypothetical protein